MRLLATALILWTFVTWMIGDASAHVGPTFFAYQVDPHTITIDGLGSDPGWNAPLWNPQNTITREMLGGNVTGGVLPPVTDWDAILKVGWSAPPDNMLYFYSQVTDDLLNDEASRNGNAWRDDALGILIDANHDGGNYDAAKPRGTIAQEFLIRMSERDLPPGPAQDEGYTRSFIFAPPERAWLSGPPWMVVEVEKPVGRMNVTYAYEAKMVLWDRAGDTPETSVRHVNAPDQTIGLSFWWDDTDAELDRRDDQPGTQGPEGANAWYDAGKFGDVVLVGAIVDRVDEPSGVEVTSWGAIKASFRWSGYYQTMVHK